MAKHDVCVTSDDGVRMDDDERATRASENPSAAQTPFLDRDNIMYLQVTLSHTSDGLVNQFLMPMSEIRDSKMWKRKSRWKLN
jgi:hypothetical protein